MTQPTASTGPEAPRPNRWIIAGTVAVAIVLVIVGVRVLAGIAAGDGALDVEPGVPVTVEVRAGSSASDIARAMEEAGVVRSRDLQEAVAEQGVASQLQAGTYHLETLMVPEAVLERLISGPDEGTGSSIIVYEGHDVGRVLEGLAEQTGFPVTEFEAALTSGAVTSSLLPAEIPEGADDLR